MVIKIYYKSPTGVVTLKEQFGAVRGSNNQEVYTVFNEPVTRTLYNIELDVPLEGGSFMVDVETYWRFENSSYTLRNMQLGQVEVNGLSERTGTRIGHISRRLMQYNMYRIL